MKRLHTIKKAFAFTVMEIIKRNTTENTKENNCILKTIYRYLIFDKGLISFICKKLKDWEIEDKALALQMKNSVHLHHCVWSPMYQY